MYFVMAQNVSLILILTASLYHVVLMLLCIV